MKNEKIILPTDTEAARFVENISGWVDINNRFYGDDERAARYSSSTHFKCECGNIERRGWMKCAVCREISDIERYSTLQFKEWNGKDFVYSGLADKYFKDSEEIEEYCEDNDIESRDLRLVLCDANEFSEIDGSQWEDIMPEDSEGELPDELQKALDALNAVIKNLPPASYSPGRIRTEYKQL